MDGAPSADNKLVTRRAALWVMYSGALVVVVGLGHVHARFLGLYDFTGSSRFGWSLAYVVLLCVAGYGMGLPDLPRNASQALSSSGVATLAAAGGISFAQLVVGSALLPRFVVFWSAAFLVPGYALCAFLAAGHRRRGAERDRVLGVVSPEEAAALTWEFLEDPERPAAFVRTMSVEEARPRHEGDQPLFDTVLEAGANVVVLDRLAQSEDPVVIQAAALHEHGIRVRTLSLFYDEWLGKLPISELERVALMFDIGELHRARYCRARRVADLLAALGGCLVLAAVLPVVAIGNAIANRGPLLYRQVRIGKGEREFVLYKFRTMRTGAGPPDWTADDDCRITPFGRFLRRSHLDELPQVVNILKGDLATVGPRPEQPRYVAELVKKLPFYRLRHLVRPGLTGWAQVKYPYGADHADALEKLQYEFYYLRHQRMAFDVRIIGRTIRSVLMGGGR